jgi:SAM-dependent methyltransferase
LHIRFLEILADPDTHEALRLENAVMDGDIIVGGDLVGTSARFPIIRGIPRFAGYEGENYARSFAWQWKKFPRLQFESENVGGPMAGYTRRMWELITGITGDDLPLKNKLVLDVGCGPGRFTDVARAKGADVIALDYSMAVEVAADNFRDDPDVCVVQGDALKPPVRDGCIDAAFSIGVLHHTPSPIDGVRAVLRTLKPGGWFAVSVYARRGYYDFPTVQMWRRIFSTLWPVLGPYPALAYSYATVYALGPVVKIPRIGNLVRIPFPFVPLADRRWSVLDTFDSLTPSYQSAHDNAELTTWFQDAGYEAVQVMNWSRATVRGTKPSALSDAGDSSGSARTR